MALNHDQLKLLQEFINDTMPGTYDAMDLIPEGFRQYFSVPTEHGKEFRAAVEQGTLKGLQVIGIDLGSKHWRYRLHGG